MAPSSQMFSQGGMRSKDWFSDRLDRENTAGDSVIQFALCLWSENDPFIRPYPLFERHLPVQSIAHFNGDEH